MRIRFTIAAHTRVVRGTMVAVKHVRHPARYEIQWFTLRFVDALTVAEIARRSGTDQAALYRRLSRVLRRLRTGMEQHDGEARVG